VRLAEADMVAGLVPVESIEEVTVTLRLEDKKEIVEAVNKAASGAFSDCGRRLPWSYRRANDCSACEGS